MSDHWKYLKEAFWLLLALPEVVWNCKYLLEWAAQKERIYGLGYSVTLPRMRLIEISRPDWIEHVQKTNFQNYVKGSLFQEVMSDVFGQGIFVTDGAVWKSTRQVTTRIFNSQNFKTIVTPAIHKTLRSLNDLLEFKAEQRSIVELDDLFHKFTLESFLKMTFSRESGSLSLNKTDQNTTDPFANAFDFVQKQMDLRFVFTAFSIPLGRLLSKRPKTISARKTLDEYVYQLIDSRRKSYNNEQNSYHDLLGLFMNFSDEKGVSLSRTELKDSALNLIIAGRDTTAQALSWTFFHLIEQPELLIPMRKEIEEILTTDDDLVDYENYKQFIHVLAVFHEALRLHPSVPKNAKFAINHDKLPDGPIVEPNDCLRWSDWQMARDPNIWGPDCVEFKPNRWIDEDGKLKQFGQWKFHAFNGGPRICLGMHLATLEAVGAIVEIVRRYDLKFEPGWLDNVPKIRNITPNSTEKTPRYGSSLTLPMAQRMRVILTRRAGGKGLEQSVRTK
ncbi:hypothetical protein CROQUDRAFT_726558 [Cronartium quercuum f. sp. fusiforme G11]|uniref:Cytochrome P450 n=1 Tax=Cronartium quercuum f. sp. fusiforme G11 TaxID=708437 RepID=A0A9P6N5W1_9BASI|nr:hypothetical protein CROQUDRAFT_726558 [Cronartium quercuum f. sp. fusiforme G11]